MDRIWTKRKQINTALKPKVFVGMSGGVDSSVTAALLKELGFDVVGVHIKMWSDPSIPCHFKEDRYDAMRVADTLGIPFQTWDLTEEYKRAVVDDMIREYAAGRTPNPDVACNREIKFGVFLRRALDRGADYVATGHYVRRKRTSTGYKVLQAQYKDKDQSYFLWTLTQEQLAHCLFPIGAYTKPEVREMARAFSLPTAEKKDSQGICFIGEIDIRDFLKTYIPREQGPVLTTSGKVVGEHEGLAFYTMGQRGGLHIGGGIPYYVAAKDFDTNTLVVGEGPFDEKLFKQKLAVRDVNWIADRAPKLPFRCEARIRYRQPLQKACIRHDVSGGMRNEATEKPCIIPSTNCVIHFEAPQRAVTPGQSVVFYHGEEMIGGGVIDGCI